jgi:hypothetical protein
VELSGTAPQPGGLRAGPGIPRLRGSCPGAAEPIVHSAIDAVSVFERSDLDALVIPNFVLRKKP